MDIEQQQITIKEHIEELLRFIINSETSDWEQINETTLTIIKNTKKITIETDKLDNLNFISNNATISLADIYRFTSSQALYEEARIKIRLMKVDFRYNKSRNKMIKFFALEDNND